MWACSTAKDALGERMTLLGQFLIWSVLLRVSDNTKLRVCRVIHTPNDLPVEPMGLPQSAQFHHF